MSKQFLYLFVFFQFGCSTLFPEFDPYTHTSVKLVKEASVSNAELSSQFSPSLGIPKSISKSPWVSSRNSYIYKGFVKSNYKSIWQQIEKNLYTYENTDIEKFQGSVSEKLEAALGNYSSIPKYLEKSLVSSHNSYMGNLKDLSYITDVNNKIIEQDKKIGILLEKQLESVQNLRETIGEIKILEARIEEIQAALPAKQLRLFIDNLAKQANELNQDLIENDNDMTIAFKEETKLRNDLIHKENQLRVKRSDQLFFANDVSDNLISSFPVLGSGWAQWATFMLNEQKSWNLRDDSLGWAIASLKEKEVKEAKLTTPNGKKIEISKEEMQQALSWYYSLYSDGLEASKHNCSIAKSIQTHRDGLICNFIPGRNNCKSAAIFDELEIVDDLRDKGFLVYLSGRTSNIPKVGVILGVIDENHYHVAEYDSLKTYFENELSIENKDYSNSISKVIFIPKKCSALSPDILHKNLVTKINGKSEGFVLELSIRGQPIYVPVHQVRIEQIPLLMKNGKYSRTNQVIDAGFVDSISGKFLNPNTQKLILTKATINITPQEYFAGKPLNGSFKNMTFMYLLELDLNGEIIGGTWYIPFPKKDLGFEHRWFHVIKPTGIFYTDDVSTPVVGSLHGLFSNFKN